MSACLGIDIGATFIKCGVLDRESKRVRNIKKIPTPGMVPTESRSGCVRYEHDADKYVTAVQKMLRMYRTERASIDAVVISSQMHGMVLVTENNTPVTPFIGWQDERMMERYGKSAKTWMDSYISRLGAVSISHTGLALRTGLAGPTLYWLMCNGVLKKYPNAVMLTIGDYVAAKLTKGRHIMHPTHACGTGLFDVKHNAWDRRILSALGISEKHMPHIASDGDVVGYMPFQKRYVTVYPCIGDLQAALLGSGITTGSVSINIGTGSQVSVLSKSFSRKDHDVRSFIGGSYLKTVTFIPAGRAINVLVRFIETIGETFYKKKNADIWKTIHVLTQNKTGSEGLKACISYFPGNATGYDSGSWENVSETNWTGENMIYSAFENMVENYWQAYTRLGPKDVRKIILSGGLARKLPVLRTLITKRFQLPVELAEFDEETLYGLVRYADMVMKHK